MSYQINVTPKAVADIEEIRAFIAAYSQDAAERILELLESAFESLRELPRRHVLAPEARTHHREIRQMLVDNYRVLYRSDDEWVHILRIRHAAQKPFKPGELN